MLFFPYPCYTFSCSSLSLKLYPFSRCSPSDRPSAILSLSLLNIFLLILIFKALSHLSLFYRGPTKSRSLSLLNILVLVLIFKALSHLSLFSRGSTKSRSQITSSGGLPAALLSKNRSLIIDTHIVNIDTETNIQFLLTIIFLSPDNFYDKMIE